MTRQKEASKGESASQAPGADGGQSTLARAQLLRAAQRRKQRKQEAQKVEGTATAPNGAALDGKPGQAPLAPVPAPSTGGAPKPPAAPHGHDHAGHEDKPAHLGKAEKAEQKLAGAEANLDAVLEGVVLQQLETAVGKLETETVEAWYNAVDALDPDQLRGAGNQALSAWADVVKLSQSLQHGAMAPAAFAVEQRAREQLGRLGLNQLKHVPLGVTVPVEGDGETFIHEALASTGAALSMAREALQICGQATREWGVLVLDPMAQIRLVAIEGCFSAHAAWYQLLLAQTKVPAGTAGEVATFARTPASSDDDDDDDESIWDEIGDGIEDVGGAALDGVEDVGEGMEEVGKVGLEVAQQAPGAVLSVGGGVLDGASHIPGLGKLHDAGEALDDAGDSVTDFVGGDSDVRHYVREGGHAAGFVAERVGEVAVVSAVAPEVEAADVAGGVADAAGATTEVASTGEAVAETVETVETVKTVKDVAELGADAYKIYSALRTTLDTYDKLKDALGVGIDMFRELGSTIETYLAHANDPSFDAQGEAIGFISREFDLVIDRVGERVTTAFVATGENSAADEASEKDAEKVTEGEQKQQFNKDADAGVSAGATVYEGAKGKLAEAKKGGDKAEIAAAQKNVSDAKGDMRSRDIAKNNMKANLAVAGRVGDKQAAARAMSAGLDNSKVDGSGAISASLAPAAAAMIGDTLKQTLIDLLVKILEKVKTAFLDGLRETPKEPRRDLWQRLKGAVVAGAANGLGAAAVDFVVGRLEKPLKTKLEDWLRAKIHDSAPELVGVIDLLDPKINEFVDEGIEKLEIGDWIGSKIEPAIAGLFGTEPTPRAEE